MSEVPGYVKIFRKILDHPFYLEKREYSKFEAMFDIIMNVNHSDQKVSIKNQMVECSAGQSVRSLETWASRWGWKSKYKVKSFLELMQNEKIISLENLKITTRLTLLNWESYQYSQNTTKTQPKHNQNQTINDNKCNNENIKTEERIFDNLIPSSLLEIPNFKENWINLVKSRMSIKKPLTELAAQKLLNKLEKNYKLHDIMVAIDSSIINGWQDVFFSDKTLMINTNGKTNGQIKQNGYEHSTNKEYAEQNGLKVL